MKELVEIKKHNGNGYVVSSRIIAKGMKKQHSDVIESLEKILQSQENSENGNFRSLIIPSKYRVENQRRSYKEYLLTKDGFILYMFHIQGHTDFKLAYINEFNRMEKLLKEQEALQASQDKVLIPLSKAQYWARIRELADSADEIRSKAYKRMCQLTKDMSRIADEVDRISDITFEVEKLIDEIEK